MADSLEEDIALAHEAAELGNLGKHQEAIEVYTRLLARHPVSELYNQRGVEWYECGDFEKAILDLTAAIALKSEDPDCYVNRGNAYFRSGNAVAAFRDYDRAVELSPRLALAFNGRGVAHEELGRVEDAIRDFMAAIEVDRNCVWALFNVGAALLKIGKPEEALGYLDRANALRPNDVATLFLRGDAQKAMGAYEIALSEYEQAVRVDPTKPAPQRRLAWLLSTAPDSSVRNGERALRHAQVSCELTNWRDGRYLAVLAAAHAECGDFQEAVRRQKDAIRLASAADEEVMQRHLLELEKGIAIRD